VTATVLGSAASFSPGAAARYGSAIEDYADRKVAEATIAAGEAASGVADAAATAAAAAMAAQTAGDALICRMQAETDAAQKDCDAQAARAAEAEGALKVAHAQLSQAQKELSLYRRDAGKAQASLAKDIRLLRLKTSATIAAVNKRRAAKMEDVGSFADARSLAQAMDGADDEELGRLGGHSKQVRREGVCDSWCAIECRPGDSVCASNRSAHLHPPTCH
jgi:hypothetical protein